jgi:ribonuclease J
MICTGCQGEPRSALSRIALFDHPAVELDGRHRYYSSREIPGNEKAIARIQNLLVKQGIDVVTSEQAFVHASGHAGQPDIAKLYEWVQPQLSVPVHGELRHQTEHARLARHLGVSDVLIPTNGQIVRLGPGVHEVVAEVQAGRWGLDGKILRALDGQSLKHRRKMNYNGAAVITLALDKKGMIAGGPQVTLMGVEEEASVDQLCEQIEALILMKSRNAARHAFGR